MTNEQEIRAKALELAILVYDCNLDLLEAKQQEMDTKPIDTLFKLADVIQSYLMKPL